MRKWILSIIRKYFLTRYERCREYADYMKAHYPFCESFGHSKAELASEMAQVWLDIAETFGFSCKAKGKYKEKTS